MSNGISSDWKRLHLMRQNERVILTGSPAACWGRYQRVSAEKAVLPAISGLRFRVLRPEEGGVEPAKPGVTPR